MNKENTMACKVCATGGQVLGIFLYYPAFTTSHVFCHASRVTRHEIKMITNHKNIQP